MATEYWSRAGAAQPSPADVDSYKKSRRRLVMLAISAVFLVTLVVVLVVTISKPPETTPKPQQPSFNPSIKAICDRARYPDLCLDTVGNATNNTSSFDPSTVLDISIQIAMDALGRASKHIDGLSGDQLNLTKRDSAAFKDCKKLVSLAISQLNNTLAAEDITSPHVLDDLKTWLSSAITLQDVCVDGFRNASAKLGETVDSYLKNTTKLSSNSLSILTGISKFLQSLNIHRKLLGYNPSMGFPSWVKPQVRKLLQDGGAAGPKSNSAELVVAQDGSGGYTTITDAVAAVPTESDDVTVIYVKEGRYVENIWIAENKWNVLLKGDGMSKTVISFNLSFFDGIPTFSTASIGVLGKGFVAMDIGFENTAGSTKLQAVAMTTSSDQSVYYRVKFDGFQDTLYSVSGRQFYRECTIAGTVDFIFGNAAAVYQDCTIVVRAPPLGSQVTITAQGKTDPNMNTGFSIHNCKVEAKENMSSVGVYLGRPWKPYSTVVYAKTAIGGFLSPEGWLPWTGRGTPFPETIYYGEYANTGAGADTHGRVQAGGIHPAISAAEAQPFSVADFIGGEEWLPRTNVPYKPYL